MPSISIAVLVTACLLFVALISRKKPEMISGFKWSDTPEGKEADRKWLDLVRRTMNITALITLIGSLISILIKSNIFYIIFLVCPILVEGIYISIKRTPQKPFNATSVTVLMVTILVVVFVAFFYLTDLKVHFEDDHIKISGMYGMTMKYSDICQIGECESLPPLSYRSNGFAFGKVKLGYFKSANGNTVKLYVHSDSHFIFIEDHSHNLIYISKKRTSQTDELYNNILNMTLTD